ncbi:hypothetical protein [Candidatus Cloacimonas acidaminovorans]|uniref:hypothetical protein n=1 Tax=Candidatus Cloacimonas acidaminovorans TaxID=456827 RepID=UPI001E4507F9|nr:hypothetical protein [Candidatus Cloacimonas acidaminovorans]
MDSSLRQGVILRTTENALKKTDFGVVSISKYNALRFHNILSSNDSFSSEDYLFLLMLNLCNYIQLKIDWSGYSCLLPLTISTLEGNRKYCSFLAEKISLRRHKL